LVEVIGEVAALLARDALAELGEDGVRRVARELLVRLRGEALLERAPEHPETDEGLRHRPRDHALAEVLELRLEARVLADLLGALAGGRDLHAALGEEARDRVRVEVLLVVPHREEREELG